MYFLGAHPQTPEVFKARVMLADMILLAAQAEEPMAVKGDGRCFVTAFHFSCSSLLSAHLIGLLVFQYTVANVNELPHCSTQGAHFGFSCCQQSFILSFDIWIF